MANFISLLKEVDLFVEEDQRLLGALAVICEQEMELLGRPDLAGLAELLQEKEALQREIESRTSASQSLWKRVEQAALSEGELARTNEALGSVRGRISRIQELEQAIAARLQGRREEVRGLLGHISKKGKALSAYRPNLNYSPRFVDKRE
ncbi:MAG: hypothetical protein O2807_10250 [bacterium]|nr:hypothetical protein [bacterium]